MGSQCLQVLIGLKVLVMMNSLQNIVISGTKGLLMLMVSKFLIKMTRPQNINIINSVLWPGHLYQKFYLDGQAIKSKYIVKLTSMYTVLCSFIKLYNI